MNINLSLIGFLITSLCFGADPLPEKSPVIADAQKASVWRALYESQQADQKAALARQSLQKVLATACPVGYTVGQDDHTGDLLCVATEKSAPEVQK